MRILELFCGTKSIGKVFEQYGHEVISLDNDKQFNPTKCVDILEWDYKEDYKTNYFDIIWASPVCTSWSKASGGKHRLKNNMVPLTEEALLGERFIYKTLEIIDYFKPKIWFIENPVGLLQYFEPMINLKKTLIYYGNYKDNGELYCMTKPTHIWSNIELWENEKKPDMDRSTYDIVFHKKNNSYRRNYKGFWGKNAKQRSIIPSELVHKIYNVIV